MSSYHTQALVGADIFTVMGSIYAEVARYDAAIDSDHLEQAAQAVARAEEIIDFTQQLQQLNQAQKREIQTFRSVFLERAGATTRSGLDDYLLPFAMAARMRQFK